jgi:23S rRNA pseudouridine2605 synthase
VTIKGNIPLEKLNALRQSMDIDGYKIMPVKVDVIVRTPTESLLQMTLFEGRNRQIRKMCATVDLEITRLCRVAMGDITLGELPLGKWRYLTDKEI